MLQLHLSDQQFNCLPKCVLYFRLDGMYLYSVLIFLYKCNQQILPESFFEFFIFNNDVHDYQTRQQYDFHTPFSRCFQRSNVLRSSGVEIHNYFRNHINFRSSFLFQIWSKEVYSESWYNAPIMYIVYPLAKFIWMNSLCFCSWCYVWFEMRCRYGVSAPLIMILIDLDVPSFSYISSVM